MDVQFAVVVDGVLGGLVEGVVDLHDRGLIAAPVAVVGSGEHGHHHAVVLPLVPLHDQLVRPCDEVQAVDVRELFRNVLSERVPRPPG